MGIRTRVTFIAAIVVLAVLSLAGVALATAQRVVLTDSVDEVLHRQALQILGSWPSGLADGTIPGQGDDESFAVLTNTAGVTLAITTTSSGSIALEPPAEGQVIYSSARNLATGTEFRLRAETADGLVVYVATPLDDVNDSVAALARGLWVSVPTTTALLALTVWLLVGRVLRPVEAIRREVSDIRGTTLDRRVPEPTTRDEIARLAKTMNEMLDRIEEASKQQQRFVDDASHELRTPLTRMRTELEIELAHPSIERSKLHDRLMIDVVELQNLIDDLLAMARNESTPGTTAVDLDDLVFEVVAAMRKSHSEILIDSSQVSAARTVGSRAQLSRLVSNILDNAHLHGAPPIVITLEEREGRALLSVADSGSGIPAEELDRVFDRFVRLDPARTRNGSGAGLGLSISRAIALAHHGTISVDQDYGAGTRFVVSLPLAEESQSNSRVDSGY